jgi:hypothetical protein
LKDEKTRNRVNLTSLDQLKEMDWTSALITYKQTGIFAPYNYESRTYRIYKSCKYFMPAMCGSSLFGTCLDGTDEDVRLDLCFANCPIESIIIEDW